MLARVDSRIRFLNSRLYASTEASNGTSPCGSNSGGNSNRHHLQSARSLRALTSLGAIAGNLFAKDPSQLCPTMECHIGRFLAFPRVMFAADVREAAWSRRTATITLRAVALIRLAVCWMRTAVCGLRGHDMVLDFEPERLSLRCLACGARTQGWTIDVKPAYRPRRHINSTPVPRLDGIPRAAPGRRYEPESPGIQLKAA
jgi:hypothetical protein